ncbi:hypothetical protein BGZ72_007201 [Mortierella alpina]|nr:hypothetical protein BGZ72_007201 [Mortierella alpina]
MYIPPAVITTTENRWIDAVVTGLDRQATLALLCSLINSALKYNPSGWGLPYNHVVFSDQKELLASSTYLPGSTKQVKCYHETLMLCWKTLELNKRFRTYLLETNRVLDIVVILLYFSLEHKLDTCLLMDTALYQQTSDFRAFTGPMAIISFA